MPLNFYWQRALETQYPGFPSRAEISTLFSSRSCSFKALCSLASLRSFVVSLWPWSADSDAQLPHHREKEKEKMAEIQEQTQGQASSRWAPRVRKSGLHAFMMKFLFDQTVAGVVNIVLFVFLINVLKGVALGRVWELIIEVCPLGFISSMWRYNHHHCTLFSNHVGAGLSADYDRPDEIPPDRVNADVHCHPRRPACRLWQCVWSDMGNLSQLVRCSLIIVYTQNPSLHLIFFLSVNLSGAY